MRKCNEVRRRTGGWEPKDRDRFWAKVRFAGDDDCWEWMGERAGAGYGIFYYGKRKKFIASRLSWEWTNGESLGDMQALHTCDNPPCVNPKHLFRGTPKDNYDDMVAKGRRRLVKGSGHPRALLVESDIPVIRAMLSIGVMASVIAKKYGVSPSTIGLIKKGRNWTHV